MEDQAHPRLDPCELCREIVGELQDIATWLSGNGLNAEQFAKGVVDFERRKHARFGYRLETAVSERARVHFSLRHADTGELCASMEIDAHSGDLTLQRACV